MHPPASAATTVALLLAMLSSLAGCKPAEQAATAPAASPTTTAVAPAEAPSSTALQSSATPSADVPPPEGVLRAYVWDCDGGLTLRMKNLYGENAITLDLQDGPRKLPQVVSASGARYSDGPLTFWTKGGTATFERQGSAPVNCRELRYESLLADARERGVRYHGRGNEPGWTVEVGPGAHLEFVTNYGQERHAFDAITESGTETAGARVFRATRGNQHIKVSVTTAACADDMSDERFEQLMIVEFGGKWFRGCATALQ